MCEVGQEEGHGSPVGGSSLNPGKILSEGFRSPQFLDMVVVGKEVLVGSHEEERGRVVREDKGEGNQGRSVPESKG